MFDLHYRNYTHFVHITLCCSLCNNYCSSQGKVVIRPIAFKPAAPSPAQLAHGLGSPCGPIAGVGGRPSQDPRYTSTPALGRDGSHHYGSKCSRDFFGKEKSKYQSNPLYYLKSIHVVNNATLIVIIHIEIHTSALKYTS